MWDLERPSPALVRRVTGCATGRWRELLRVSPAADPIRSAPRVEPTAGDATTSRSGSAAASSAGIAPVWVVEATRSESGAGPGTPRAGRPGRVRLRRRGHRLARQATGGSAMPRRGRGRDPARRLTVRPGAVVLALAGPRPGADHRRPDSTAVDDLPPDARPFALHDGEILTLDEPTADCGPTWPCARMDCRPLLESRATAPCPASVPHRWPPHLTAGAQRSGFGRRRDGRARLRQLPRAGR